MGHLLGPQRKQDLMRASGLLVLVVLGALGWVAPAGATTVDVLADGLRNPRHLDFGAHDTLYVAESGTGGGAASCFDSAEGFACVGATGAVTRIRDADETDAQAKRIVDGLASFAPASGDDAIGPHGIFATDRYVYVTNGGPTAPMRNNEVVPRDQLAAEDPVADLFGRLLRFRRDGQLQRIADIWAFERDQNPDATAGNALIDSNPVDVHVDPDRYTVADAGGNTVVRATRAGEVSLLQLFPSTQVLFEGAQLPMQAVPTGVVEGPDGNLYVSQLTGFPFLIGAARVFVLDPDDGSLVGEIEGFTNAMDLAFGPDGTLYVLEIDANSLLVDGDEGAIFRVRPGGSAGEPISLPPGTLTHPGGIAVGDDGTLYVTNRATSGSGGQVLRIRLGA